MMVERATMSVGGNSEAVLAMGVAVLILLG